MTKEINYFTCGYCIYGQLIDPPEDKKKDYPVKRGYCIFEPPQVFPMPQPKQTKIQAMGNQQQGMDILPFMMRPVVEEHEPMCGRGVLTAEAMKGLGIEPKKEECPGCELGNCGTEGAKCEC